MRYQGTVEDAETIAFHVLAKAKCMIMKQLPKESALATGHILVATGKDWYVFDLRIKLDRRDNTGVIDIERQCIPRLCNIAPEIVQIINHMIMIPMSTNSSNKIQVYNKQPISESKSET